MRGVLFVHQNFPGQFPHIAQALVERGERCVAIGSGTARAFAGVHVERWSTKRGSTPDLFPLATRAEADLIRAHAAAEAALRLKARGFEPRLIIGHPGWGETLLLKEVWPDTPQILFAEFFYRAYGADVGFDPEFGAMTTPEAFRIAAKNMGSALALSDADKIVAPTPFQASLLPRCFAQNTHVLHEGVDTDRASRREGATFRLSNGQTLDGTTPLITFVNRSLEPLRGFHIFMRALPRLLAAEPEAQVLIIGSDTHNPYGARAKDAPTWKAAMLQELGDRLDLDRIHFTGKVSHADLMSAFSISWAHVYFTYPFVLSWSLVEAMACECLVIASDTAPVRDAVEDGFNGQLVDFFDVDRLSEAMIEACREPERFWNLRRAARQTAVGRFDRARVGVPGWLELIDQVAPR